AEIGEIGDHARRLPDGRVVVLEQTGENLAVVVLDQSGKVSLRAPIPNSFDPETCVVAQPGAELDEHGWGLNVQEANAFAVDVEHDQACLQLQDRNDNMAELGLFVAVGLGGGEIQTAITFTIE